MKRPIFLDVAAIMEGLFNLPTNSIQLESSMDNIEQWDSLQHINVIVDIEQRYGIEFSPEEVTNLNTVQAIVDRIEQKLEAKLPG